MESTLHLGDGLRDNLIRVFCFVGLPFAVYFLYLDLTYNHYVKDYLRTQQQEVQTVNEKIKATILDLRLLTEAVNRKISIAPDDYRHIQSILKAGISLSQKDKSSTLQEISYYKLSYPQAVITPDLIAPLSATPKAFRKPTEKLMTLISQNNALVMNSVLDKDKRLHGVLEVKVPSLDVQKIIGVDQLKTLEFPQLFDRDGKKVIQNNPLDYTYKSPLAYNVYMKSYASHFWVLAFFVLLGSPLIFLTGRLVKKREGLSYRSQIGQLRVKLENLSMHNSLQRHRIQQTTELSGAIYKSMDHARRSSISASEKQALIHAAAELAEDLSSGIWSNHKSENIPVKNILDQIVLYFSDQIQKLNINLQISCSEDLTLMGDPLFVKMILLNIIGYPLFSMPKQGTVIISAVKVNGFIHIEVQDNRYSLSEMGKKFVKAPFEFFVESHKLQKICFQSGIGYSFSKTATEEFLTKVSFPLDPTQTLKAIPFPTQGSSLIH